MELEMVRKENCMCSLFRAHSKQVKVLMFGFLDSSHKKVKSHMISFISPRQKCD